MADNYVDQLLSSGDIAERLKGLCYCGMFMMNESNPDPFCDCCRTVHEIERLRDEVKRLKELCRTYSDKSLAYLQDRNDAFDQVENVRRMAVIMADYISATTEWLNCRPEDVYHAFYDKAARGE